jgi:hypothetical protein
MLPADIPKSETFGEPLMNPVSVAHTPPVLCREDFGLSVAFLCGPGGRYITGTMLDVNGGLCMR